MKLFKLNSSYLPNTTLDNFDSLVWTERFRDAGEFQLVVEDEIGILQTLPIGTLISHTDTREVMIVENHEIKRTKEKLTVKATGRSFETFLEERPTLGSYDPLRDGTTGEQNIQVTPVLSSSDVAINIMRHAIQPGTAVAGDAVPNTVITGEMRVYDTALAHVVRRGDTYGRVLEYLSLANAGVKTVRPLIGETNLTLIVHDGINRLGSVIFYAQREDLEDTDYFWSIRGYKTHAALASDVDFRFHKHRDISGDPIGLNRRIAYAEASEIEGIYTHPDVTDLLGSTAQNVLDQHRRIALLQATISDSARPKFKFDYDVGDLVTVFGEFATSQAMRVTEHILTVDKDGMRGFPSLSAL